MNLKETTKKFTISYENLYRLSYRTATMMERDLEEFANYGIEQSDIDAFKKLYQEFIDSEQDNALLASQMFRTEEKNRLAEEVRKMLYRIMLKVRAVSEKSDFMYLQFRNNKISKFTGSEFVSHARLSIHLLNRHIDIFSAEGVTPEVLASFEAKVNSFNDAYMQQQITIVDRDIATQRRMEQSNEVYKLLKKYAYIGKNMWAIEGDEARGNDYIIESKSSAPPNSDSGEGGDEGNQELPNG